jgi:myosin-3
MHREINASASSCKVILKATKLENWKLGRTKIFLKYYHVEKLGHLLDEHRIRVVVAQTGNNCSW